MPKKSPKRAKKKQLEQHIWIVGEVNYEMAKHFFEVFSQCKPGYAIVAHICSGGGDVEVGFAIHDALRAWPWGCTTIGMGMVGSIAAVIFCAGQERLVTPHTNLLVHPMSAEMAGTVKQIGQTYDSLRNSHQKMVEVISDRCNADSLQSVHGWAESETYLSPDTAMKFGLVTGIIDFAS